jgi:hypothetical protein
MPGFDESLEGDGGKGRSSGKSDTHGENLDQNGSS